MSKYYAFCDRNGTIEFGVTVPDYAIRIFGVTAEFSDWLKNKVEVLAPLAKTNDYHFVPNLFWIKDNSLALDMLRTFIAEVDLFWRDKLNPMPKDELRKLWCDIGGKRQALIKIALDNGEAA